MKKLNTKIAALVLGGSFIMSSCTAVQNANNTQKGAGIGAVASGIAGVAVAGAGAVAVAGPAQRHRGQPQALAVHRGRRPAVGARHA